MTSADQARTAQHSLATWIFKLLCVTSIVAVSFSLTACFKQEEANPIPTPAQEVINTPTKAPEPARGDKYINALKAEERTAAAAAAELYIKEKTQNRLDRLVLNPSSEFWEFPEDLNEFNKVGCIITFDAYVDGNAKDAYRIVLVRGNTSSKEWEVKRFRQDNKSIH